MCRLASAAFVSQILCKRYKYFQLTRLQVALTLVGLMTPVVKADAEPNVEGRSLLGLGVLGLSPLATPGLGLIIRLQQLQRLRQLQQLQRLQQVQLLLGGGRPALGNNEDRRPAYTPGHSLLSSCFKASFLMLSVSVSAPVQNQQQQQQQHHQHHHHQQSGQQVQQSHQEHQASSGEEQANVDSLYAPALPDYSHNTVDLTQSSPASRRPNYVQSYGK